ncbi:MAG: DUF3237 domain-containing protein [Caulobacter sp.]|nr:DUF3237 domain-containing protein [Caulobacter sp.]
MSQIDLPKSLTELRTRPLMRLSLVVRTPTVLGRTPGGERRIGVVTGGRFEGEGFAGEIQDGGSDWQTIRADGAWMIDCRMVLTTDDGALIGMRYGGIRTGNAEVLDRLARGEPVDPSEYYFRITPTFETADARYDWLNRVVAVGVGHRFPTGPVYNVFEVL